MSHLARISMVASSLAACLFAAALSRDALDRDRKRLRKHAAARGVTTPFHPADFILPGRP